MTVSDRKRPPLERIIERVLFASRWLLAGPDRMAGPGWPSDFTPLDARPSDAERAGRA